MLALPRSWNKAAPTTPLLCYIIAYTAHKVNIGTAAARCERSRRQKAAAVLQQAFFQMQGADKAWCSAAPSLPAENIDTLPATF